MTDRPLLMIPGPVEISPAVREAFSAPPPSHTAPDLIAAFGRCLAAMRRIWGADAASQPLVVAGGGTVGMDMAAANLVEAGDRVLVAVTGYFGDRMAEMLRRQGATVLKVTAPVGDALGPQRIAEAVETHRAAGPLKALFATHVDTSTGVLLDPEPLAAVARQHGLLSVFDGVCATGGETFRMNDWGADVYLTGSQKALGAPPGLSLLVMSRRAMEMRKQRTAPAPPMYLDWLEWLPIMEAYEEGRPSYFSTPATSLILALDAALAEISADGVEARVEAHRRAARGLRRAWSVLGLQPVPTREEVAAHTLSALRFPDGIDGALVGRVAARGVVVAGGLHPALKKSSFRIGHMGWTVTRPALLQRTVEAVAGALGDSGLTVSAPEALEAFHQEVSP